jgi:haloalkane dehalogenase
MNMTGPNAWLDRGEYPFASHMVRLRDGSMHYADEGSGPPVVLSHGTPTWSFEYRHVIRVLARTHRVIAPDHLGFGLSERPPDADYSPEAHGERFREFVDQLGLGSFALVVHDYGGPIALPLALDGRVSRLVLMNTWMWSFDDDPEMRKRGRLVAGAFGRFLYRNLNASLRMLMPSAYGDRRRLTPRIHRQYLEVFRNPADRVRVLWPLARGLLGSRRYYDELFRRGTSLRNIPTLIVWGMKDSAFRPHQLDRWVKLLPMAQVARIPDAGHWPHEEAPSEVAEAIERFLQD